MADLPSGGPWHDTRGPAVRLHVTAHADDAKHRRHDGSVRAAGRRRYLLAVGGALALLLIGGGAIALTRAVDDEPSERPAAAQVPAAGRQGANGEEPTDEAVTPLTGRQRMTGRWTAENEIGQTFTGRATLDVACGAACRVELVRFSGEGNLRLQVLERTYRPSGDNTWVAAIDQPLEQTLPGCEALRAVGTSTLTWDGTQVDLKASVAHRVLPGNSRCVLIASTIGFVGTPS